VPAALWPAPWPLARTQDLGLGLLGAALQSTWQPHEELLFCLGM
jgi:hypothetical protein